MEINVVYVVDDKKLGTRILSDIRRSVLQVTREVTKTLLVVDEEGLDNFLLSDGADFILLDNFFGQKENSDLEIVPKLRAKFPESKIVSFSMLETTDKSIYDNIIDMGKNHFDHFNKLLVEISNLVKPA